ncbi:hypothetical protein D3C84_1273280 [compost metagenome]
MFVAKGQIVCWGQPPCALIVHGEGPVFGVIIVISGNDVEDHAQQDLVCVFDREG